MVTLNNRANGLHITCSIISGYQIMDYYGVPGWRLSPGLDEGWKIRRKSYSNHTEGSAQRLGLFAFRNETTQRYQR